jgi:hypothetical protein
MSLIPKIPPLELYSVPSIIPDTSTRPGKGMQSPHCTWSHSEHQWHSIGLLQWQHIAAGKGFLDGVGDISNALEMFEGFGLLTKIFVRSKDLVSETLGCVRWKLERIQQLEDL